MAHFFDTMKLILRWRIGVFHESETMFHFANYIKLSLVLWSMNVERLAVSGGRFTVSYLAQELPSVDPSRIGLQVEAIESGGDGVVALPRRAFQSWRRTKMHVASQL